MTFNFGLGSGLTCACVVLSAGIASADATLEEITVTATKREATIQEIPMSIVAISGENILEQGIGGMIIAYIYGKSSTVKTSSPPAETSS